MRRFQTSRRAKARTVAPKPTMSASTSVHYRVSALTPPSSKRARPADPAPDRGVAAGITLRDERQAAQESKIGERRLRNRRVSRLFPCGCKATRLLSRRVGRLRKSGALCFLTVRTCPNSRYSAAAVAEAVKNLCEITPLSTELYRE